MSAADLDYLDPTDCYLQTLAGRPVPGAMNYELNSKTIRLAFDQLEDHDLVVGPAKDGGYYLLGMKEYLPQLFKDKAYSNDQVLNELLTEAEELELSVHQLAPLNDCCTNLII